MKTPDSTWDDIYKEDHKGTNLASWELPEDEEEFEPVDDEEDEPIIE